MALKKSELYSSIWKSCDELRGGMDASQYKDYVLVLLFVKYVSDKYATDPEALIEIPKGTEPGKGGSYRDMVFWKGKAEIGDQINKIIGRLAEANDLKGVIDVITDFNNSDKLGRGKEMVDRLSNLIAIFENPALDFSRNRAEGDDLLGDAYEYLMKNFAVQSGKSKGQFYTPAEVSRVMSKVIGISLAKSGSETVYDPTCGSGSLLIKAASEAGGKVSVYGQELDNSMAALAKMNMILHDIPTAEIHRDNTLSSPFFKNPDGSLKTFDFAVANPPFSQKNWRSGFNPEQDEFRRFDGFGIPPNKNGDYAFLLHLIKSLKSAGKGAIILPHGVLFRSGAEAAIRENIIKRGYFKGIIGLPSNLFYGTPIAACILVIDKENAVERKGIFIIDASRGFVKDGNKNRLREQDIHKIVDVFTKQTEIPKYSRLVPYDEIAKNEFNLNIPRYIDSSEPEDLQDIEGHLQGGIPSRDIHALREYWEVFPALKSRLFSCLGREGYLKLEIETADLNKSILEDPEFVEFKTKITDSYGQWKQSAVTYLKAIKQGDKPKEIIRHISEELLARFKPLPLIDAYEVYQILMQYWGETMQDDAYMIVVDGWLASPELIPAELLIKRYFQAEQARIDELEVEKDEIRARMEEMEDEYAPDGNDDTDAVRFPEDDKDPTKIDRKKIKDLVKSFQVSSAEREVFEQYLALLERESSVKTAIKKADKAIKALVQEKYARLSLDEIKLLVVEDKWLAKISDEVEDALDVISRRLTGRIKELAERYAQTLPQIEDEIKEFAQKVEEHLMRIGFSWK